MRIEFPDSVVNPDKTINKKALWEEELRCFLSQYGELKPGDGYRFLTVLEDYTMLVRKEYAEECLIIRK